MKNIEPLPSNPDVRTAMDKINQLVEAVNELANDVYHIDVDVSKLSDLGKKKSYPKSGNLSPEEYMQAAHASSCECKFCKPKPSTLAERFASVELNWDNKEYFKLLSSEAKRFFKELCKECMRYPMAQDNFVHIDELLRRIEEA